MGIENNENEKPKVVRSLENEESSSIKNFDDLGIRTKNILRAASIYSLDDLRSKEKSEIYTIRNMSKDALVQIDELMRNNSPTSEEI